MSNYSLHMCNSFAIFKFKAFYISKLLIHSFIHTKLIVFWLNFNNLFLFRVMFLNFETSAAIQVQVLAGVKLNFHRFLFGFLKTSYQVTVVLRCDSL